MTEIESPESRRDAAVAAIIAAGGSIRATVPLADPAEPHTVVAYRVDAGAPTPDVLAGLEAVRAATEVEVSGLVPWVPEPVEDEGEVE